MSVEASESVGFWPSKPEPILFLVPTGYPQNRLTDEDNGEGAGKLSFTKEILTEGIQVIVDLKTNASVNMYGHYIAFDEEGYRLWQLREPSTTESNNCDGSSVVKDEMTDKASDSNESSALSSPVTGNPKPALILVSTDNLQRSDMGVFVVGKLDEHHIAIDIDPSISKIQGDTPTTPQGDHPKAEGNNTTSGQRKEVLERNSQQSEEDKEAKDSGWRIFLAIFPLSSGLIFTTMSTKKQLPIACLFLLLLANICSTFLLAALSVRGYISLVKFFKSISMALVIAAVGLMAHTLLPELVFTVSLIVLAFIHYILVPGSMICIGRWKWDSQESKTDKESVESLWKYALMILVLSSTAILATNNMQQRPTMVCFLLVLSFLFGTSTLVLLSIRERVCTIRIRSLVLLVSAYSFASGVLMVMASGILVYSLTPKHMFILLVVIAFVITVLVPLTLIWIWRPAGDDLQSETDEDAVESGWNISLMIPIVSLIGVIGMFVPQPQPPKTCFYLLFIAFISSTVLKLVLMIRGQARSGQTRAFVLRVYYYNLISFMFVLFTLVYVAVNYLVKYVQAGGFP